MSTATSRIGLAIVGTLAFVALAAPILAPYDPDERVGKPFGRPSSEHLLGTDDVGHDLLSVLIHGARASLLVGLAAALAGTIIGVGVGVIAGYLRGWPDLLLMRIVDVVLALPVLPLTIVIGVFAGPGLDTQVLVIAIGLWAPMARELRSQVLSLRERDHILALRAMGAPGAYILGRHVIPGVFPLIVPQLVLAIKTAILLEASLSFLGLGDVSVMSWGSMLSHAHSRSAFLTDAWLWWVIPPGLAIGLIVLGFALLGTGLETRSRPQLAGPRPLPDAAASAPAAVSDDEQGMLVVQEASVRYGPHDVVSHASLVVPAGQVVGIVGESGSGKSTLAAAMIGLLPAGAELHGGAIGFRGERRSQEELRALLGTRIGFIPQEAMSALNPVHRIGPQIEEAMRGLAPAAARERARALMRDVGIDPARYRSFPHEFSGGMRQRIVIAIALAGEPELIIADEPTSGLDVMAASEILDLLDRLRRERALTIVIISHDLPVIDRIAERIVVMQHGAVVESGTVEQVLGAPTHPHARELVESVPVLDGGLVP
ncbi:dipeptide/oligopeptide/nickel ABC transporter permease/ATP-binding protein [Hoyosella sp. G463]|uniref:Nickel import system ATP-binding protein NikD n=1 Tax=Lolliginicoccus lacisalsi TaxID=2742202 RepID=A0A927J9N7_9ACTN|nr:dipeptide/oligopeptide/nickel ABC transporter permease/ATP-binding protein [Lolliginicoccus lacisalsi]MBD8505154.1 dipeptide/oligopeptide/nickel ABC transporter permease/ATP-binding protein [Lolliginicoccus lacisalsi]